MKCLAYNPDSEAKKCVCEGGGAPEEVTNQILLLASGAETAVQSTLGKAQHVEWTAAT